jgi:hypothetical protein
VVRLILVVKNCEGTGVFDGDNVGKERSETGSRANC